MGRPSDFAAEIADSICEKLSSGESLRTICSSEEMPHRATICRWLATHEAFRDQYARACEVRESEIFDQMLEIADTPQVGQKTKSTANGLEISEADMIEHRRLQVETRKWVLAKMAPKKYGEKIQQEHSGALTVRTATDLKDDELAAIATASGN